MVNQKQYVYVEIVCIRFYLKICIVRSIEDVLCTIFKFLPVYPFLEVIKIRGHT